MTTGNRFVSIPPRSVLTTLHSEMIRCLHIRDLAIIREATLELGRGLNLLTGETGAGKSIVVDALTLALGGRSGPEMIRDGAERASIEAEIDLEGNAAALAFLAERGLAAEEDRIVARREIAAQGKSRAFLGGTLVSSSDLRALAALLVDLHGQHQHQTLLMPASHRALLDRHAGLEADLGPMADVTRDLRDTTSRLLSMRDGAQRVAQRIDMLRFQIQEIDAAAVRPDERAALRTERDLLRNAGHILKTSVAAYEALYDGDTSALARLSLGIRAVRELARFDPALEESLVRAETAQADLQEMALQLRGFPARLEVDPGRLEAIEDRLHGLENLLRKYSPGGDEAGILAHRAAAEEELSQLTGEGGSVSDLETRLEALRKRARELATALSRARKGAAAALEKKVEQELRDLAMERTRFAVDFRVQESPGSGILVEGQEVAVDAAGCDVVEFLLSANEGEAMRPLAAVASGGELSRIMLALEVVLRRDAVARTLVFDEVDAGVGGAAATAVGRKLKSLARIHQVICVTHLPQIASCADRHVLVSKRAARGRTEVVLEPLDDRGQVRELARMLAGSQVTPAALRHAAELLARGAAR